MSAPPSPDLGRGEEASASAGVKVCSKCGSRFSGDARFCPFDAEPLRPGKALPDRDPLLGTTLDERYEIDAVVGEGGMGTVYRARHRLLDKKLAVKVLRADLSRDADLGVRFIREAKAAAAVSHPNVVQITDFGTLPSGQPYFVMELLQGTSLSSLVRKGGPIPAARAVRLLLQIVDALAAAHAAGVIHRDLKPDNIVVCAGPGDQETAKVLDFGLAKVAGQSRLTRAGLVFGTPHYMSPEQASGGVVDERTDIYSLGIIMYEMFTGRVPFEADSFMGVLTKHLYVAPTPPSVILGGIAELGALEQVTLRCLEKKPERRHASMAALGDELRRVATWAADGTFAVKPAELGEPRAPRLADELELPTATELSLARAGIPRKGESKTVTAALAVVIGLGLALATYVVLRRTATPPVPSAAPLAGASPAAAPRSGLVGPPARPRRAVPQVTASASPPPAASVAETKPEPPSASKPRSSTPHRTKPATGSTNLDRNTSTNKEKMVGGEIVDPWSR